jgi:uncharacterized membrane protein YuzA (DUF378 family)
MVGKIAWILILIGGLNWGLIGLGMFLNINLNIFSLILTGWPKVEALVYLLVGVAVVLKLMHKKCGACMPEGGMKM